MLVLHLKIKCIFDQPQIKPNDKIRLRKYHQQVKITNTWLLSIGCENRILYYENEATINSTNKQDFIKPDKFCTFLHVIPVTVIHGENTTVVNALLDSGSDTTLITSEIAKILKLKGKQRNLNITSAISTSVSVTSTLVEFSICSTHHPDQIEVKNTLAFGSLNLPSQRISKAEVQQKWSHLRDVPIDVTDKDISILIGVDLSHLHICHDVISGNQNEPRAMLTKPGWGLLGGNNNKTEISPNHIISQLHIILQP